MLRIRLIVLLALLVPSLALADAIEPPPDKCPPGAIGESSHEGAWCQPATCVLDGGCPKGAKCRSGVGLCVTRSEVPCGGLRPPDLEPCTTTIIEAHGPCATDVDCPTGSCEVARRCVPGWNPLERAPKPPASGSKGCGCAATGTASPLGAALLLGLGLLLRLSRRR